MEPTLRRYLPGLAETIGLVALWCCITVAGGHGFAPLGIFVPAWGLLALPVVAWRIRSRALYAAGLALLLAACVVAILLSEVKALTVPTALPFLGLAALQLLRLVVGEEAEEPSLVRPGARKGDPHVRWPRGRRPTIVRPMSQYLSDAGIRERLDAERRALLARIEGVPAERLATRPAPDRWSVAEVLEHLARIETGVTKLLAMKGLAPPPADAPAPGPRAILTPEIGARVRDRSWRIEAPERVRPVGGIEPAEALRQLTAARERLLAAYATANPEALDRMTHPHPVIGPLTLRSWVALTADHEARHAAQVAEIVEQVGAW